jgi:hypothetical protein
MAERTDDEVLSREFAVTLGGEVHQVPVKSILLMGDFRKALGKTMAAVAKSLGGDVDISPLIAAAVSPGKDFEEVARSYDFAPLLERALPILLGDALDSFVSLLWLYEPSLEAPAQTATDEEILGAILEVLRVVYPLAAGLGNQAKAFLAEIGKTAKQAPD